MNDAVRSDATDVVASQSSCLLGASATVRTRLSRIGRITTLFEELERGAARCAFNLRLPGSAGVSDTRAGVSPASCPTKEIERQFSPILVSATEDPEMAGPSL